MEKFKIHAVWGYYEEDDSFCGPNTIELQVESDSIDSAVEKGHERLSEFISVQKERFPRQLYSGEHISYVTDPAGRRFDIGVIEKEPGSNIIGLAGLALITEAEIDKLRHIVGKQLGISGKLHKCEYLDEEEGTSTSEDMILTPDKYIVGLEGIWGVEIEGRKYMTHIIGEGGSREHQYGCISGRCHPLIQFVSGRYGWYSFSTQSMHDELGDPVWNAPGELQEKSFEKAIVRYMEIKERPGSMNGLTEGMRHSTWECSSSYELSNDKRLEAAVKENLLRII